MTKKEVMDTKKKAQMFKEMAEKTLQNGEYVTFDSDDIENVLNAYIASLRVIS